MFQRNASSALRDKFLKNYLIRRIWPAVVAQMESDSAVSDTDAELDTVMVSSYSKVFSNIESKGLSVPSNWKDMLLSSQI